MVVVHLRLHEKQLGARETEGRYCWKRGGVKESKKSLGRNFQVTGMLLAAVVVVFFGGRFEGASASSAAAASTGFWWPF